MKTELNRSLIEGLKDSTNKENIDVINEKVSALAYEAISALGEKSSFVDVEKVILTPIDEAYSHALCSRSEYNYILAIANKEIEINSVDKKKFFVNFWKRLKYAWKVSHTKKSKKKKGVSKEVTPADYAPQNGKYDIKAFKGDVILNLANFLSTTSIIYDYDGYISIVGNEDFGTNIKINIFVGIYDEETEVIKLFNNAKNRFDEYSYSERFENLSAKYDSCGEQFTDVIRVLNSLYSSVYDDVPNQILIESLVYNCPNDLFVDDFYQTFLNITNYIRMKDGHTFRSIVDTSSELFKEKQLISVGGQLDFQRLIGMLDKNKI